MADQLVFESQNSKVWRESDGELWREEMSGYGNGIGPMPCDAMEVELICELERLRGELKTMRGTAALSANLKELRACIRDQIAGPMVKSVAGLDCYVEDIDQAVRLLEAAAAVPQPNQKGT
jgi:hypothetical protein